MKRFICGFLLWALVMPLSAQDFHFEKSRSSTIPTLPDSMTYNEFEMLSRRLTWQRIMIAGFVPGYVHFYAGHKKLGYAVAGVRSVGMMLSLTGIVREWQATKKLSLSSFENWDANFYLFITGLFLNAAGYAFDIANGDHIIETERMKVQFKFRKPDSPCFSGIFAHSFPAIALNLKLGK